MSNLSTTQTNVLIAINRGIGSRGPIAAAMKITPATVSTALTALKNAGLIVPSDDGYSVTPEAAQFIGNGRKVRGDTKMAKAREIFGNHAEKGRQAVLKLFKTRLGLSDAAASTYYQSLNTAAAAAQAAQVPAKKSSRKAAATA